MTTLAAGQHYRHDYPSIIQVSRHEQFLCSTIATRRTGHNHSFIAVHTTIILYYHRQKREGPDVKSESQAHRYYFNAHC